MVARNRGYRTMEIKVLVGNCIQSAIEYGIAAYEVVEDPRNTNRLYDKYTENFKVLKTSGKKGILELEKLLEHPNDYVKYCSATHLLSLKEKKAKIVLNKLTKKPKLFGFSVKMLLKQWDKGALNNLR